MRINITENNPDFTAAVFLSTKSAVNRGFKGLCHYARFNLRICFAEIDFLVASDRGDRYLSDAFGPMKNIFPSQNYWEL